MADEKEQDQKTEDPTSKRLEESREEGQVPVSQEVRSWFMLMAGFIAIAAVGPSFGRALQESLTVYFAMPEQLFAADGGVRNALFDTMVRLAPGFGAMILIFVIAALAGTMVQTGLFAAPKLLEPKIDRISPIAGWKRVFGKQALVEFLKGLLKITIVGIIMYKILQPMVTDVEFMSGMDAALQMQVTYDYVLKMLGSALIIITFFAGLDYAYQRYKYFQQVRMTKQEVKDEMKQSEGDPYIRARLRQIRLERSRRRMMTRVPEADVVITNPTHYAVALEYKVGKHAAPRVIAKGQDMIALKIREIAAAHDVPMVENPPLARALNKACDIEEEIPVDHYKAVAEIISYVYKLKKYRIPPKGT